MLRRSTSWCKAKSLHDMFRKLKLQGAHPDVLWSVDAQKAQHNGDTMIRLETLFHQRATGGTGAVDGGSSQPTTFSFWLRPPQATGRVEPHQLLYISCSISPRGTPRVVKSQLQQLFRDAGITDDFDLGTEGVEMNLEQTLRDADARQTSHVNQAATLYVRGDKAISNLRKFGVLVVVEEGDITYLVTLPERTDIPSSAGSSGITGPTGVMDYETQEFLRERNLKSFDLRMAGSYSSVERFVSCFERLESLYNQHRGLALRPCVCVVLSLKGMSNFVADDGCIVLSLQQMPTWEEYLLSLPTTVWKECVALHQQWRLSPAPKLAERRRQLIRVADMFHVFGVVMEHRVGGSTAWQEVLMLRLYKEEAAIRSAVKKYRLTSDVLKRRGQILFRESLESSLNPGKPIGFRVTGDGKLIINQSTMTTPQILKALRENIPTLERLTKEFDALVSKLEFMSRSLPLDFSVDSEWKGHEEANLVNCLAKFVATMKANHQQLDVFLRQLLHAPSSSSSSPSRVSSSSHKRLVWIISNKFETMPSGVVFVPWDVEFDSIKKMMIGAR